MPNFSKLLNNGIPGRVISSRPVAVVQEPPKVQTIMPALPRVLVLNDRVIDILAKNPATSIDCLKTLPKKTITKTCGCKNKTPQSVVVTDYAAARACITKDPDSLALIKKHLKVDQLIMFITNADGKAERVTL